MFQQLSEQNRNFNLLTTNTQVENIPTSTQQLVQEEVVWQMTSPLPMTQDSEALLSH